MASSKKAVKPKTRKKSFYAFETELGRLEPDGKNISILRWDAAFAEKVFSTISKLPLQDKVFDVGESAFFYLDQMTVVKKSKRGHKDHICGWFTWTKYGLLTDWIQRSTLTTRENLKNQDESEKHRSYFYLRLSDGLLLLDHSGIESVVTYRRLEDYLKEKAKAVYTGASMEYMRFSHIVDKGFLDQLFRFETIRVAKIRFGVESGETYDTSDGIGSMQSMAGSVNGNFAELVIGRQNAKKHGLFAKELKELFSRLLHNRQQVKSAVIEGKRGDGKSPKLRLDGIEEKHSGEFQLDIKGEVLPDPVFEYIIDIGNKREALS